MMKRILLSLALCLSMTSGVFAKPFVFTAIPDQDETALQERFDKVAVYLTDALEHEVK